MEAADGDLRDLRNVYEEKFEFPTQQPKFPLLCHKDFVEGDGGAIKAYYDASLFGADQITIHSTVEGLKGRFSPWPAIPFNASEEKINLWNRQLDEIKAAEKWGGRNNEQINATKVYLKPERLKKGGQKKGGYLLQTHAAVPIPVNGVICVVGGVVTSYNSLQELRNRVNPNQELLVLPFPYLEYSHFYKKFKSIKVDVEIRGPINPEEPLGIETFVVDGENLVQMNAATFVKYAGPNEVPNAKLMYVKSQDAKCQTGSRRGQFFYLVATRPIEANEKIKLEMVNFEEWTRLRDRNPDVPIPSKSSTAGTSSLASKRPQRQLKKGASSESSGSDLVQPSPIAGRTRSKKKPAEEEPERQPVRKRSRPLVPPLPPPSPVRSLPPGSPGSPLPHSPTPPPDQASLMAEGSPQAGPAPKFPSPEKNSTPPKKPTPKKTQSSDKTPEKTRTPNKTPEKPKTPERTPEKTPTPEKGSEKTPTTGKPPTPEKTPPFSKPVTSAEESVRTRPRPLVFRPPTIGSLDPMSPGLSSSPIAADVVYSPTNSEEPPASPRTHVSGIRPLTQSHGPSPRSKEATPPPGGAGDVSGLGTAARTPERTAESDSNQEGRVVVRPQSVPLRLIQGLEPDTIVVPKERFLAKWNRRRGKNFYLLADKYPWPEYPYVRKERVLRSNPSTPRSLTRSPEIGGLLMDPTRPATAPLGLPPDTWRRVADADPRAGQIHRETDEAKRIRNIVMSGTDDPVWMRNWEFHYTGWSRQTSTPWWLIEFPDLLQRYIYDNPIDLDRYRQEAIDCVQRKESEMALRNANAYISPAFGLGNLDDPSHLWSSGVVLYDKTMPMDEEKFFQYVQKGMQIPDVMRVLLARSYTLGAWHRRPRPGLDMDKEIDDLSQFILELFDCTKVNRLIDPTLEQICHLFGFLRGITDKLVFHCKGKAMILPILVFAAVSWEKNVVLHTIDGKELKLTDFMRLIHHYFGPHDSSPQLVFPIIFWCGPSGFHEPQPVGDPDCPCAFFYPVPLGSAATIKQSISNIQTFVDSTQMAVDLMNESRKKIEYVPQAVGSLNNVRSKKRCAMSKKIEDQVAKSSFSIQGDIENLAGLPVSLKKIKYRDDTVLGIKVRGLHLIATYDLKFLTDLSDLQCEAERIFHLHYARRAEFHYLVNTLEDMKNAIKRTLMESTTEYLVLVVSTKDGTDTTFMMGRSPFQVEYKWLLRYIPKAIDENKKELKLEKSQGFKLKGVIIVANHGQGVVSPRGVIRTNTKSMKEITTSDARCSVIDFCELGTYTGEFLKYSSSACPAHPVILENRDLELMRYGACSEDVLKIFFKFKEAMQTKLGKQRHITFKELFDDKGNLLGWGTMQEGFQGYASKVEVVEGKFESLPFLSHSLALGMEERESLIIYGDALEPSNTDGRSSIASSSGRQSSTQGSRMSGPSPPKEPAQGSSPQGKGLPRDIFSVETDAKFRAMVQKLNRDHGAFEIQNGTEIICSERLGEEALKIVRCKEYYDRQIEILSTVFPFKDLENLLTGGPMTAYQVYAYGRLCELRNAKDNLLPVFVFPSALLEMDLMRYHKHIEEHGFCLYQDNAIAVFLIEREGVISMALFFTNTGKLMYCNCYDDTQIYAEDYDRIVLILDAIFSYWNGMPETNEKVYTTAGMKIDEVQFEALAPVEATDTGVLCSQTIDQLSRRGEVTIDMKNLPKYRELMFLEFCLGKIFVKYVEKEGNEGEHEGGNGEGK